MGVLYGWSHDATFHNPFQGATEQTWTNHPLIRTHHVQIYKWLSQIYKKDPILGDSFRFLFLRKFLHNPVLIPFSVFVWSNLKQELPPAEAEKYPQDKGTQNFSDPSAWSRGQISCGLSSNCRNWIFGSQLFRLRVSQFFPTQTQPSSKSECLSLWPNKCGTPFFQTFQFSREVKTARISSKISMFSGLAVGCSRWNAPKCETTTGPGVTVAFDTAWWWNVPTPPGTCSNWLTGTRNQMLEIYLGRSFQNSKKNWKVLGSRIHIFVAKIVKQVDLGLDVTLLSWHRGEVCGIPEIYDFAGFAEL